MNYDKITHKYNDRNVLYNTSSKIYMFSINLMHKYVDFIVTFILDTFKNNYLYFVKHML